MSEEEEREFLKKLKDSGMYERIASEANPSQTAEEVVQGRKGPCKFKTTKKIIIQ